MKRASVKSDHPCGIWGAGPAQDDGTTLTPPQAALGPFPSPHLRGLACFWVLGQKQVLSMHSAPHTPPGCNALVRSLQDNALN